MNKIIIFTCLIALSLCFHLNLDINGDTKKDKASPPQTVPYVNLTTYLGLWYEQARIPFYWERGCEYATATYSKNSDGSIKVNNTCVRDGKTVTNIGKAVVEDTTTNAKLKVEFVQTLDIGGQYWVVRLASDYSYSVVCSPDYRYTWILYRQPVMPQALYDQIIGSLNSSGGFRTTDLVRTKQ